MKLIAVSVVALVVITQTGCVPTNPAEDLTSVPAEGIPLSVLVEAPERVPSVRVGDAVLAVAQYEWFADGGWDTHLVVDPRTVPITNVEAVHDQLIFEIDTAVAPQLAVVSFYPNEDSDGLPDASTGSDVDCHEEVDCRVRVDGDRTRVTVKSPQSGVVVLRLAYAKTDPASTPGHPEILSLTASWATRVGSS